MHRARTDLRGGLTQAAAAAGRVRQQFTQELLGGAHRDRLAGAAAPLEQRQGQTVDNRLGGHLSIVNAGARRGGR